MADYGMRISKPGVDVLTGADVDMYFSTKFKNALSLATYGSGSYNLVQVTHTVTIPHNLGYNPFYMVMGSNEGTYFKLLSHGFSVDGLTPDDFSYYYIYVGTDTSNLYITFTPTGSSRNETYYYYYYISSDRIV